MEETWDESYFWKQLELQYGQINVHLKNILRVQNLCRQSLANLTRKSISKIAEDMRRMSDHYIEAATAGGDPLHELYGPFYAKQPQKFEFLEGEVICLLDLAAIIRSRGIKSFLKPRKKQVGATKLSTSVNVQSMEADPNGHKLFDKILMYFTSQNIPDPFYDDFLGQLQDLKVQVFRNEDNKYCAEVICPICSYEGKPTKISLTMDRTGSWHIFGFTRHCNSVHLGLSSKKKRNCRFDPSFNNCQVQPAKRRRHATTVRCDRNNSFENSETDNEFLDFNAVERLEELPKEPTPAEGLLQTYSRQQEEDHGLNKRCIDDPDQDTLPVADHSEEDVDRCDSEGTIEQLALGRKERQYDESEDEEPALAQEVDRIEFENYVEESQHGDQNTLIQDNNNAKLPEMKVPLLDVHIDIKKKFDVYKPRGIRYNNLELDVAAYEFMTAGNSSYKFKRANMQLPCVNTIKRHVSRHTSETLEGVLMIQPLKKYLKALGYPMMVALSEDGTPVSPNPEYDPRTDSIRGLVPPFDNDGMPKQKHFLASSVEKMISDIEGYPVGEYLYAILATPMVIGASPFCVLYMCSDNKFTHEHVIQRWHHVEAELKKAGIKVVAHCSDGDPRLLTAMKVQTSIPNDLPSKMYGPHFVINIDESVVCIQDTIHLVNKLRHSLLDPKKQMVIGNFVVSAALLKQMLEQGQKVIHKLNPSDLNASDRMKFDPSIKLMSPELIDHLQEIVPSSNGTVVYLKVMRNIYLAFTNESLSPLDRIELIWTSLFFIRAWRKLSLKNSNNIKQCPTSNTYLSLEINAHGLIKFLVQCRENNVPEQFIVPNLSSQPCETTFRELRSMTTMNHTAVNFTMKEVEQRMQKVQMKLFIIHRNRTTLNFPSLLRQQCKARSTPTFPLPNDEDIRRAIEKAEENARGLLDYVGCRVKDVNFTNSVIIRNSKIRTEFEFVAVNNDSDVCNDDSFDDDLNEGMLDTNRDIETVEYAEDLFKRAGGEIILRECGTDSKKHVFNIVGVNGKVIKVRKSTMLWVLSSGRFKRSNDRLRRFHQIQTTQRVSLSANRKEQNISIGDWVVLLNHVICHVSNFQFETGRSKSCPLLTVPLLCPEDKQPRGIMVLGNFYTIGSSGELILSNGIHRQENICGYISHIESPKKDLFLSNETLVYLQTLNVEDTS